MAVFEDARPSVFIVAGPDDWKWAERVADAIRRHSEGVVDPGLVTGHPQWVPELSETVRSSGGLGVVIGSSDFPGLGGYAPLDDDPDLARSLAIVQVDPQGFPLAPEKGYEPEWDPWLLPQDLKPLRDRHEKEVEGALREVALAVLERLGVDGRGTTEQDVAAESEAPTGSEAPAESEPPAESESASETDETAESETTTGADEILPISKLEDFYQSPSVKRILRIAIQSASVGNRSKQDPPPLSTSFLLFAIGEHGKSTPRSTAGFAYEQMSADGSFDAVREKYLKRKLGAPKPSKTLREPEGATAYLLDALGRAQTIAKRTNQSPLIHTRHLLAGILDQEGVDPRSGALERLDELGLPVSDLRSRLLDHLVRVGTDSPQWETLLTGERSEARPAAFHSDRGRGERDLLGITPDVEALANLIAARTVSPPLAVGLFGEWGSGKTFFMNMLRKEVTRLAEISRGSGQMQRDLPHYKNIVQIDFNAWQYIEGNLWASLVEHIFSNLLVRGESRDVSEKLTEHLLKELKLRSAELEGAEGKVSELETELGTLNQELTDAKQAEKDDREKLEAERKASPLPETMPSDVHAAVSGLAGSIGLGDVADGTAELGRAIRQAREVLSRGGGVLTAITRADDKRNRFIFLLVALLAAPLAAWIIGRVSPDDLKSLNALAAGAATGLATLTAWIRRQADWLSERVAHAERVQAEYDAEIETALTQHRNDILDLENQVAEKAAAVEEKERERARKEAERNALQARIEASTPPALLAQMIEDRVSTNVYSQHLGVVSLVREDFETLSGLMEEENRKLEPPRDGETPRPGKLYETLKEEEKGKDERINRIILYIDDLDRCRPVDVVRVLEAVHLLLAFPLFVVVVGVDSRWITRSLASRYRELLHAGGGAWPEGSRDELDEGGLPLLGHATPDDYLEKIFQIPFWLEPMDEAARRRMVNGLVGAEVAGEDGVRTKGHGAPGSGSEDAPPGHKEQEADAAAAAAGPAGEPQAVEGEGGKPSDEAREQSRAEQAQQPGVATGAEAAEAGADAAAEAADARARGESLEIEGPELWFMRDLAPLLGRSPRALKRFVNVYRLLKAGLSRARLRAFRDDGDRIGDYQAAQMLLALDTGLPRVADHVFAALMNGDAGEGEEVEHDPEADPVATDAPDGTRVPPTLEAFLRDLEDRTDVMAEDGWQAFDQWIRDPNRPFKLEHDIGALEIWAPRVARHSFRARYTGPRG